MNCIVCEKELAGGLDTFGPPQEPRCWECFIEDYTPPITQDDVDRLWREIERELAEDAEAEPCPA